MRYQRRLKVVGGAGTGKTRLALKQARRLARDGERVALVCYSRGLARFLERATACWPVSQRPAYAGLFHQLPVRWGAAGGAEDDSDYWERRLPLALGELARAKPPAELFDSVVVEEAQDFGALWWPPTLACLRDPDAGGLFVFLDEAQRVFARRGEVPIPLPPYVLDEGGAGAGGLLGRVLRRDRRLLRPRAGLQGPGAAGSGALHQRFPRRGRH